jgi:hypothetical protein
MREGEMAHALESSGIGCGAADVELLARRIGADDQEIRRGGETAMTRAGRQEDDVACADEDLASAFAAEEKTRRASDKAEDFVSGGVIVVEVIDTVAPLRWPPVTFEERFAGGGGIGAAAVEHTAVEQNREAFVVRNPEVTREAESLRAELSSGRFLHEYPLDSMRREGLRRSPKARVFSRLTTF